jgi:hypothetical protein
MQEQIPAEIWRGDAGPCLPALLLRAQEEYRSSFTVWVDGMKRFWDSSRPDTRTEHQLRRTLSPIDSPVTWKLAMEYSGAAGRLQVDEAKRGRMQTSRE